MNQAIDKRTSGTKRSQKTLLGACLMVVATLLAACLMMAAQPAHAFSIFTVNSTADTGDATPDGTCNTCTLREAIQEASNNNNPSHTDQINFNISGTGVHTISPTSPLPDITEPLIINGYSQPGSSVNKLAKGTNAKVLIEINGTNSGAFAGGLFISASDSVVKGLVINRFLNTDAIGISTDVSADPTDFVTNVRIEGNFLGTDPSGT